jgi:hypothetical protein
MVALQNLDNNEVLCKIVLDKELEAVFGLCQRFSAGRRLRAGTMIGRKTP